MIFFTKFGGYVMFARHKIVCLFIPAEIRSRPSENCLVDFCTSALLKASFAFFWSTMLIFRAFKSAEVQEFARVFHMVPTLDFSNQVF